MFRENFDNKGHIRNVSVAAALSVRVELDLLSRLEEVCEDLAGLMHKLDRLFLGCRCVDQLNDDWASSHDIGPTWQEVSADYRFED